MQWLTRFAATDNKVRAGMVSVRRKDSAAGVWRARHTHLRWLLPAVRTQFARSHDKSVFQADFSMFTLTETPQ